MSHSEGERVTGEARGRGQDYSEVLLLVMQLSLLNLPQKPPPGWYPFGLPCQQTHGKASNAGGLLSDPGTLPWNGPAGQPVCSKPGLCLLLNIVLESQGIASAMTLPGALFLATPSIHRRRVAILSWRFSL